jgi:hypothetical protein
MAFLAFRWGWAEKKGGVGRVFLGRGREELVPE